MIHNVDLKEWKSDLKKDRERSQTKIMKSEPYDFEIVGDGIGMLKIYSFSVPHLNEYEIFLSKMFSKIQSSSIHSLIIDVRGNYGGWPKISSILLQYLTDGHFSTMARSSTKVSETYRRYIGLNDLL